RRRRHRRSRGRQRRHRRGARGVMGVLSTGMATSIGSLPHTDPDTAAAVVLARHPELPAAPQLPARSAREGMIAQVAQGIPGVTVVMFIAEPSLAVVDHPGFPLPPHAVVDMLTAALASLHGAAATGVHCCGPTDWRLILEAAPDILSLPVALAGGLEPTAIGAFLTAGGWVAWGAIPTDAPVSDDVSFLWRHLLGVWSDLVRGGCPSLPLRERALVTPACGLAGH